MKPSLHPSAQQEAEYELDMETEGEMEGVCEPEEACEELQYTHQAEDYPAVIVAEVSGASLTGEQDYSARVLVFEDKAYLMQEVGNEQNIAADGEAGET